MPRSRILGDINSLEKVLQAALAPVTPRPDYITNLKLRLLETPYPTAHRSDALTVMLIVGVGLASSLIFIVTSVRAFLALNQAIDHLRVRRSHTREDTGQNLINDSTE